MKRAMQGVSRRQFIAGSVGTGLFMGLGSLAPGLGNEAAAEVLVSATPEKLFSPVLWFEINERGDVVVNITKAEMGQHVGTALARVVAEELGADWSRVSLRHVDSDPKWGVMVTGGSWSVVTTFEMLSRAGAAGRRVLLDAAAERFGVDVGVLSVENSVISGAGHSIGFGELVAAGGLERSFSEDELAAMPIKPASERRLIGRSAPALDVVEKSRGEARYGIDAELPGMVYACPLIAPTRYGSRITAIDDSAARAIAGYQQTLQIDDPSGYVQGMALVIANSYPAALRANEAVSVTWEAGETARISESDILAEGERLVNDPASGALFVNEGDAPAALEEAAETLSATYRTGSVLHFTLEPQNALVEFRDGRCHIHAGNQWQSLILPVLAKSLGMPETDIVLHTYYLGGGFGRRLFGDQMIPAAHAARQLGRPVKLVMPRPADSVFDCVRSPSVAKLTAAIDADGRLSAIDHAAAAGWPTKAMAPGFLAPGTDGRGEVDGFSINGADHWYRLANHRVRAINNPVAQKTFMPGWLRAVGPGWIAWGVESFMDEIADRLGVDPLEYRLSLLDGEGRQAGSGPMQVGGARRLAAVLEDVRARSGWGRELPTGEGLGVAVAHGQERAMPSWSACVAHVAVSEGQVTVRKLWQSIDCGTVVHPEGARAQAEGATLWGLSIALHEGTMFENGQVRDRNLDGYTPLRMSQVPELDIHFMDSDEFPMGLGEPPLIAVAPAIGNAIFAATGRRVRDLPIRLG